jgi:hypothetical protein
MLVTLGDFTLQPGAVVQNLRFDITTQTIKATQETDRIRIGLPVGVTSGPFGIVATAKFIPKGAAANFLFGLKQSALVRFQTASYRGINEGQGSIQESSGLNNTVMLDCRLDVDASTGAIVAPWVPFYHSTCAASFFKADAEAALKLEDTPGGSYPKFRQNHRKDRQNRLASSESKARFTTLLVAVAPGSAPTHLAVAGIVWESSWSLQVAWADNTLQKATVTGAATHTFVTTTERKNLGPAELAVFENKGLTAADTIIAKFDNALINANRLFTALPIAPSSPPKVDGGGYTIEQFDDVHSP